MLSSVYSVSLCCSVCCLCVPVYCTELYFCHQVTTHLQLTKVSIWIKSLVFKYYVCVSNISILIYSKFWCTWIKFRSHLNSELSYIFYSNFGQHKPKISEEPQTSHILMFKGSQCLVSGIASTNSSTVWKPAASWGKKMLTFLKRKLSCVSLNTQLVPRRLTFVYTIALIFCKEIITILRSAPNTQLHSMH